MTTIDTLCVRLGGRLVLDGITLHLTQNAVHGLVGINGAGKTTLMNAMYGFVAAESGSVSRNGHPLRRRDTAYLESVNYFYPGMTGRDYLSLVRHYHPSTDPTSFVRHLRLPLDTSVAEYSEGMRRKLALIAVLMQRKPVVLLDEPFNGLDIESVFVVQQLLLGLGTSGRTVLVSSHVLATLDTVCDDIYVLDAGRIGRRCERSEFGQAARELETLFRSHYEHENQK